MVNEYDGKTAFEGVREPMSTLLQLQEDSLFSPGLQSRFGECWGVAGAGVPTESLRHRERGKKLSRKAVRGRETMLPSLCWGHSGLG